MPSKILCIPLAKFLTTFFSRSPKFFTFCTVLHHAPVTTLFYYFFGHLPTFFKKTDPLDAPQGGCLGPSHRMHPPLHATDWSNRHIVRTCAVSSQWTLSVYKVLVA